MKSVIKISLAIFAVLTMIPMLVSADTFNIYDGNSGQRYTVDQNLGFICIYEGANLNCTFVPDQRDNLEFDIMGVEHASFADGTGVVAGSAPSMYAWHFNAPMLAPGDSWRGMPVSILSDYIHMWRNGGANGYYSDRVLIMPNVSIHVDFDASPIVGMAPLSVNCTSITESSHIQDYHGWGFSDGTPSTAGKSITHVFNQPGTYTITLTEYTNMLTPGGSYVKDGLGRFCVSGSKTKTITVLPPMSAAFTYKKAIAFTDTSVGSSATKWYFGDGQTSTEKNPIHVYNATGAYGVVMSAIGASGSIVNTTQSITV